jgi:hypothetical protein
LIRARANAQQRFAKAAELIRIFRRPAVGPSFSTASARSRHRHAVILPKLAVSWVEAEAAARFAAAKPREWIEHNTHSLMLRQAGRQMLNEQVGPEVEGDRESGAM